MVNTSNAPFQVVDLNQLYGIDEAMNVPQPMAESLNDYSNKKVTETNRAQNSMENQNFSQNTALRGGINFLEDMQGLKQPQPQRQEQTFPTSRSSLGNQRNDSNQNESIQLTGDLQSFLQQQVGKKVSVQFLIGANSMVEQAGTLVGVGNNYIILRENNGELLICHTDTLNFVRVESL